MTFDIVSVFGQVKAGCNLLLKFVGYAISGPANFLFCEMGVVKMKMPDVSPMQFFRMLQYQKETQVLLAAIRLDVFSHLNQPVQSEEVAAVLGYDADNVGHLLRALVAMGMLEKKDQFYCNKIEARTYLAKSSEFYLGEYFVFWERKTNLNQMEELVRYGKKPGEATPYEFYDFRELARLAAVEIRTGRVQSFLNSAESLLSKDRPVHLLDLGGGSGGMAIEFVKEYLGATGVIFEHPSVADVPVQEVKKANMGQRISVVQGDFRVDDFGSAYDLVIVSGILDFAGGQLQNLLARIYCACRPGAYLYLVSHEVNDDLTAPKEAVLGWLSSHLSGLQILRPKSQIQAALLSAGFEPMQKLEQQGVIEKLQGEWYRCVESL